MSSACVVGSGPAGAACAFGLVRAGVEVTMLDVGLEIESSLRDLTEAAAPVSRGEFLKRVRAQRSRNAAPASIPAKLPFGSLYAYRDLPQSRFELAQGAKLVCSLALGGLSNAWGANVCGLAARDSEDWPFPSTDLDPSFARLEELVEVAGDPTDPLDELYGRFPRQAPSFPPGPQGAHVLERIKASNARLREQNLYCGRAKLAIGSRYATNREGCVSCGLCMHGCPYNAIFSARDVVQRLRLEPGFRYLPGRLARSFHERDRKAWVVVEELASGASHVLGFDRLYLACGALGTTAIVARSLGLCDHTFRVLDSTKYLFPFLTDRRVRGALAEPANTLSQVFVQSVRQQSTPRTVHGQLYGYNDLMLDPLRKLVGDRVLGLAPLAAFALERIMIGMVYFHSDDSGWLRLRVHPEGVGAGLGRIEGVESERSQGVLAEFLGRLSKARRELGGRPLGLLAKRNPPGLSQHFGGSLPMRREPDPWSTDVWGRPHGCALTHCVDGSVLPSIPATPTALLLMANALRIAEGSRSLGPEPRA